MLHEVSVLVEFTIGHLRYYLTDVPPQPNSPFNIVFYPIYIFKKILLKE